MKPVHLTITTIIGGVFLGYVSLVVDVDATINRSLKTEKRTENLAKTLGEVQTDVEVNQALLTVIRDRQKIIEKAVTNVKE